MSFVRSLMILICVVSTVYFLFRAYSSIRRIRSVGYFYHYQLYMAVAGVLVSLGAAWAWASPQLWYISGTISLVGLLVGARETFWVVRAALGMIAAERALSAERRRFREHDDDDRKVLSGLRESLVSAGWACKARRFRDAHGSTESVLKRLQLLQSRSADRSAQ